MKFLKSWNTRDRIAFISNGVLIIKEYINGDAYKQSYMGYSLQEAVAQFNIYLKDEGVF